ncbi:hypothetical protein [Streptomyces turgidiscabies]|uniref:hypothetical protein n=1 Tax=Streptomyces turgidiscabies TaxID=85558 RepID=UPI0038F5F2B1
MKKRVDLLTLTAVIVLTLLISWLIVISLERRDNERAILQQLQANKATPNIIQKPTANVQVPVTGSDYSKGSAGEQGERGSTGPAGQNGVTGATGPQGSKGDAGTPGESAYQLAVKQDGYTGTIKEWLESLKVKGDKGDAGPALKLDCINGRWAQQYEGDLIWQLTKVKCEVVE